MSDPVRITNPGAESLGYDSDGHEIMAVDGVPWEFLR